MRSRFTLSRRRRKLALMLLAAGVVLLVALAVGGYAWSRIEPRHVTVAVYEVTDADLPASFDGVHVIFLTDIHHGPHLALPRVRALVDRVNAMDPDLILLGGDYTHDGPEYIEPCFSELARLRAPLGVFGVLGNHDHWASRADTLRAMNDAGITAIDNRGVWLTRGSGRIRLAGVGDLWEDDQRPARAVGGAGSRDFVLLLMHNPDSVEQLRPDQADLALAGHTHGGQVTFLGLWAPRVPSRHGQRYRTGLVTSGPVPVIVSNGIGTISPPLRFFAPPQIVEVVLRHHDAS